MCSNLRGSFCKSVLGLNRSVHTSDLVLGGEFKGLGLTACVLKFCIHFRQKIKTKILYYSVFETKILTSITRELGVWAGQNFTSLGRAVCILVNYMVNV